MLKKKKIVSPVIIIGAPRSGTTLLFSILSSSSEMWSLYKEGESIFRKNFHPEKRGWTEGNRLIRKDLIPDLAEVILHGLYSKSINIQRWVPNLRWRIYSGNSMVESCGRFILGHLSRINKPKEIRIVEKTPKNSLRVPFLDALFKDAKFVFIARDGRANVSSLIEGWQTGGRYRTYKMPSELEIEGYSERRRWTFALPPGWKKFSKNHTLAEVCAFQYITCNEYAMKDLGNINNEKVTRIYYEDIIENPYTTVEDLCSFIGIEFSGAVRSMAENLPAVNTISYPYINKWKERSSEIESILSLISPTMRRLGYNI